MRKLKDMYPYVLALLLLTACGKADKKVESHQNEVSFNPATQKLIKMVEEDAELASLLTSSLDKAKQINPDPKTNPAQSLEEYFEFVSYCETAMPWSLIKKSEYPEIFDNTFQSLSCFYWLIDQPLNELNGMGYFNNSLQYSDKMGSWLIDFSKSWGAYLDTEASWNEEYYQMAANDPAFGLQHGWYEDPSNWRTFNEFFARYLKSPDMRPISDPDDPSVVVAFADSAPQGVWDIDKNSNIVTEEGVPVKSATLKSVSTLIGEDSEFKDAFANGTFSHSFLHVNDYHRYHFPVSGVVQEVRIIQGINPTGGSLWWDAENGRYAFDPAAIGWQSVETRGCVIVETQDYGLVALLPIGMVAVGSVNFEDTVKPGAEVSKGDMLGHFAFGGSDFIVLFQDGVSFTLEAPKEEGSDQYAHMLMGERLGVLAFD